MELCYRIIDLLLPFEWTGHIFMKNALIAVLLVTPVFGLLGTMVVSNRMAFFSDAIGHSALTGIALGVIMGIARPMWAMLLFAVIFSLVIVIVKNSNKTSTDTIIGVFSSTAVALGIVILSRGGGFNKYSSYLIGDLLSIAPTDIALLLAVLVIIIMFWFILFNRIMLVSINRSFACSRGINAQLVELVFTVFVALVVTISIQWVGILIINSLLVLPAAGARNLSKNIRRYHFLSVLIALVSGVTGLILSYYWGTATGATIILVAAAFFALTFFVRLAVNE